MLTPTVHPVYNDVRQIRPTAHGVTPPTVIRPQDFWSRATGRDRNLPPQVRAALRRRR